MSRKLWRSEEPKGQNSGARRVRVRVRVRALVSVVRVRVRVFLVFNLRASSG